MSLTIEARSFDDADAGRLVRMLFDDLNERYEDEDDGDDGWWAEVTVAKVAPPDGVFLVALWEGEAVGCGALKRLDAATGEVKRMYTAPAGRRRGVARAVRTRIEDEARTLGYSALQLETGGPQHEAVALYESAGWTRIPPYGRYRDDPRSICFRKDL
jgi:GNAT superfamily N-acetyltransferase